MAETINLGIVGIKNMGEYDSETAYEKLNVVTYEGSTYCALKNTVGTLPTNTDYWQLYAQKGEIGPQGPKPVKGEDYFTEEDIIDIENDLKPTIASDVSDEVIEQIGNISNGSPLPAATMSDMTDTTRLYVLLTDGYVYYYNGTQWVQGWVYQATRIADGSITKDKLDNELKSDIYYTLGTENLYDKNSVEDVHLIGVVDQSQSNYGKFTNLASYTSFILPILPNKTITIQKTQSARLRWFTSTNYPAGGVSWNQENHDDTITDEKTFTSGANDNYLVVVYYHTSDTLTEDEIKNSIKVFYGSEWLEPKTQCEKLREDIENGEMVDVSFSSLSSDILNLMAFRPLGALDKGYLCMIADDGALNLSNYTFGVLRNKNVPCTFALMSSSSIMNNGDTYINDLKDMINNYGCSVCQHGLTPFTEYTESELQTYLDNEAAFWASKDINVKGVVYPNHYRNNMVRALCGSRYNVCCSGPSASNITYDYGTVGTRSNIFDLGRVSLITFSDYEDAIDYAVTNKKLLIVYWHDNALAGSNEYKTLFNNFIDYAKNSNIEFITLDKVNKL